MRHLVKCLIGIGVVYALSPLHVDTKAPPSPSEPQAMATRSMKDLAAAAASADAAARTIDWSQLASIGEAGATELSRVATLLAARLLSAKTEAGPPAERPAALATDPDR
ncbi:hypothetical protein [Chelatococcus reniformis]|uniref:Uncharacterized protein n=1 Tax=Chelatococcus reniformis TaxID=1494448 RepID=A0A916UIB1_9HYPH|nr:hypothetical protein [Chelatococcus reniformis]GGC73739.1 hypothetical protein GCM10010994_35140 [Chelatococcus reniformis]